jgi:hypothetical protein
MVSRCRILRKLLIHFYLYSVSRGKSHFGHQSKQKTSQITKKPDAIAPKENVLFDLVIISSRNKGTKESVTFVPFCVQRTKKREATGGDASLFNLC